MMNYQFLKGIEVRCILIIILVLMIDLGSKFFILKNFNLGDKISLISFLNLYYIRNYGTAFGFFSKSSGGWQRWCFSSISIIICITLIIIMYHEKSLRNFNIAYSLIVGGALGNLFDRILHGYVIDMIDFYIGEWHFATFNIADVAIFLGSVFFSIKNLFEESSKKSN